MTLEQKNEIIRLRKKSVGYTAIATQLGISKETVKTFCQRNNMGGIRTEMKAESGICPLCGKAVVSVPGHKPKRFCSSECRIEWWKTNPNKCNPNAIYSFICANCGLPFTAYGNSKRKYCSHECYIAARFKGDAAQ